MKKVKRKQNINSHLGYNTEQNVKNCKKNTKNSSLEETVNQ